MGVMFACFHSEIQRPVLKEVFMKTDKEGDNDCAHFFRIITGNLSGPAAFETSKLDIRENTSSGVT